MGSSAVQGFLRINERCIRLLHQPVTAHELLPFPPPPLLMCFRPGREDRSAVSNEGFIGTVCYFSVRRVKEWVFQRLGWLF